MEKGLWEKSIFFSSSFHSYMGKSTIQQNLYSPSRDQVQFAADAGARQAGQGGGAVGLVGGEEQRIARLDLRQPWPCRPARRRE